MGAFEGVVAIRAGALEVLGEDGPVLVVPFGSLFLLDIDDAGPTSLLCTVSSISFFLEPSSPA